MRPLTRFPVLLTAAVLVAACAIGPSVEKFEPATSPHGAEVRIRFRKGTMIGELIEVRDSGLVISPPGDAVFVPFTVIQAAVVQKTGIGLGSRTPSPDVLDRMRLVSRFPKGLPPDQFQRFLAVRGQQTLRVHQP